MKHRDEIIRWAKQDVRKNVWFRTESSSKWDLIGNPAWSDNKIYIIDDEWATLRKAQIDGEKIQRKTIDNKWVDCVGECAFTENIFNSVTDFRIKPDVPEYEWQWIYQDAATGRFVLTETYYTEKPEWIDDCSKKHSASRFELSRKERKCQ